jgi:hypothetical protein
MTQPKCSVFLHFHLWGYVQFSGTRGGRRQYRGDRIQERLTTDKTDGTDGRKGFNMDIPRVARKLCPSTTLRAGRAQQDGQDEGKRFSRKGALRRCSGQAKGAKFQNRKRINHPLRWSHGDTEKRPEGGSRKSRICMNNWVREADEGEKKGFRLIFLPTGNRERKPATGFRESPFSKLRASVPPW